MILETLDLIQNALFATLLFTAFTYFYSEYRYSRLMLIVYGLLLPVTLTTARSLRRKWLRSLQRKQPGRQTLLIYSDNRKADAERLLSSEEQGVWLPATSASRLKAFLQSTTSPGLTWL